MTTSENIANGTLAAGDKLGPYDIVAQIGSGGMGIVWRAHDRLLDRAVAIKQIAAADAADELARRRFRQEGELQKTLSQQCERLVEVIEVLSEGRGLFIVMEYVDGVSLEEALAQHREPIEPLKALAVVREVAMALAAMHRAGVVHRDLKPANILLSPTGAKVGDFGLASLVTQQEALPMGTAAYMAPELFGDNPVDGRADIYALGLIAYEMLVGRANYEQTFRAVLRDKRNRAVRWMKWHTNVRATVPSVATVAPNVPPLLVDLVDRMMAKELSRRIQGADALLEAIERHFVRPTGPTASGVPREHPTPRPVPNVQSGPATAAIDTTDEDQTAPLPARKNYMPWIAAIIVLNVVVLGGLWAFDAHRRGQLEVAREATATQAFEAAMTAFDNGQYDEAERIWTDLSDQWQTHPQWGVGAEAYALLASAMLQTDAADTAMAEGNYDAALEAYNTATAAVNRADDVVHSHEATRVAASRLMRHVQSAQEELPNRRAFVRQAGVIAKAVENAEFDEARHHLRDLRQTLTAAAGALTRTERSKLSDLSTLIEDQAARHRILAIDERAQRLIERGELEEAQQILSDAQAEFENHALRHRLTEVTDQIAYTAAMVEAESAIRRGRLREAVTALDRAYGVRPSAELADRLAQTQSDAALEDGRAAEARGDLDVAARFLIEAIGHWQNDEAQQLLARVQGAGQKESLIAAAEAAEAAGDYSQAVNLYQRAMRVLNDPVIQGQLNAALVRKHTSEARAALERGDLDDGREALTKAAAVNREHDEVKRLLDRLDDYHAIAELRTQAEQLRQASRFGQAKAAYREAVEIAEEAKIEASAIKELQLELELEHLVAQARGAVQAEQWEQARAYLRVALRMRPSEQLQQMLEDVERKEAGSATAEKDAP
ncbi:MAG: protein kinase [Phycisphaeraceae bacterium]